MVEKGDNSMVCNKCGKELKEGAKFCTKCGAAVVLKKICPKCKAENDLDDMFCFECGTKLDEENSNKTGKDKEITLDVINRVMDKVINQYYEKNSKRNCKNKYRRIFEICRGQLL